MAVAISAEPRLSSWIEAELCRRDFKYFVRKFWEQVPGAGTCIWNWHMEVLCDELQAVAERVFAGLPRLYDTVFNISPGTSKSTIASILFPAWVWTRMSHARILTASHTADLVLDLANKARSVIKGELYQEYYPEIELVGDQDTKGYYRNSFGGDRYTCTVAGKSPMGFHAHFQIVDDPIDPKKVLSEAETEDARQFMTEILPSRKVDKSVSVMFLIMQRLGRNDPTQVILDKGKQKGEGRVRHVCLPAELPRGDDGSYLAGNVSPRELARRYVNGLMDPVRLPKEVLEDFKSDLGIYGYAGQFLQEPTARKGGMFEEGFFTKRVRAAPYDSVRIRYWDRAATADGGCYTAGVLIAEHEGKYYVEHVVHGQWEPRTRNEKIVATAHRDRDKYGPRYEPRIVIEAERGSTGLESFQNIASKLPGFRVKEDVPSGNKDTRAEPWSDQCAAGNVYLVDDGTWDIHSFVEEHCLFKPEQGKRGRYKDQVDAAGGAFNLLSGRKKLRGLRTYTLGRKHPSGLRILCVDVEDLSEVQLSERALLLCVREPEFAPEEVMLVESVQSLRGLPLSERVPGEEIVNEAVGLPTHGLPSLIGHETVTFADLDKALLQDVWEQPLAPYGKKPAELCMDPQHGKRLWACLLKPRNPSPQVIVIAGPGGVPLSLAQGICDCYPLPRAIIAVGVGDDSSHEGRSPNDHVYQVMKRARHMVVT